MKEKHRKAAEVTINYIIRDKLMELRAYHTLSIENSEWMKNGETEQRIKELEADIQGQRDSIEILDEYISKFEVKKCNEDNL
jgi:hypothetical protein